MQLKAQFGIKHHVSKGITNNAHIFLMDCKARPIYVCTIKTGQEDKSVKDRNK